MVVAVTGDLTRGRRWRIIEKYFGQIPSMKAGWSASHRAAAGFRAEGNPARASQPMYIEGYHRPGYRDKDDAVYDTLADLLSEGRTSRLYRSLVRDKKIASEAEGGTGFPGVKYPHIFYFSLAHARAHAGRDC